MSAPQGFTRILVDAAHIVDWGQSIRLTQGALSEIERIAGPSMDTRFLVEGDQLDPKTETWGWSIDWGGPDSGVIPGRRVIALWFKNRILPPLEAGCSWLFERLGQKYTDEGRSKNGPDTPGYMTTHSDIEASEHQWDVCYDPGPGEFRFMIKPKDVAILFKLTFGGQ